MFGRGIHLIASITLIAGIVLAGPTTTYAQEKPAADKKDTRVEPTHWGDVTGRVYDADTGAPIASATVTVEQEGVFADKGQTVDKTDELGGYSTRAILGRISHNFDVGRFLRSPLIGLAFGSATNTTKRIDVARVNLRVEAPGYKPYEGPVTARSQDAKAFRIGLEPVLLVPTASVGVSTPANGWGAVRIESASVEPGIAHPGDKIKLRAWLVAFGKNPAKTVEVKASSDLWDKDKKLSLVGEDQGKVLFETEIQISKKEKTRAEVVQLEITKSTLDFSETRVSAPVVVQVVGAPADEPAAKIRQEAIADLMADRRQDAANKFAQILGVSGSTTLDYRLRAASAERLGDFPTAVSSRLDILARLPKPSGSDYVGAARALHLAGRDAEVPAVVGAYLAKIPAKKQPEVVPADLIGYLGIANVKLGNLDKAQNLSQALLKYDDAGASEVVVEFHNSLRMAQVERAVAVSPTSPDALAEYGRALMDSGRWEEAVTYLVKASKNDPNAAAIKRDLAWATLHITRNEEGGPSLDEALADAEQSLNIGKGKQESRDFFSWEKYALLLYAKSDSLRQSNDAGAPTYAEKSIAALKQALTMARAGARRNDGLKNLAGGYLSGSEVRIAGFSYPEANSCYVMLDSLKDLQRNPDDYLAEFNLSTALLDLRQANLAAQHIARVRTLKPDFVEGQFLTAILAMQTQRDDEARAALEQVLVANPRHPRANLMLADLLAKTGDPAGAAASLAAHSKWYGATMVVR